jgi:hypothetical protein
MTKSPGLTDVTLSPASSTMPQYSWPEGLGSRTGLMPRESHRSDPQMQVAALRTMASGWLDDFRVGQFFQAHVAGAVDDSSSHNAPLDSAGPRSSGIVVADFFHRVDTAAVNGVRSGDVGHLIAGTGEFAGTRNRDDPRLVGQKPSERDFSGRH